MQLHDFSKSTSHSYMKLVLRKIVLTNRRDESAGPRVKLPTESVLGVRSHGRVAEVWRGVNNVKIGSGAAVQTGGVPVWHFQRQNALILGCRVVAHGDL